MSRNKKQTTVKKEIWRVVFFIIFILFLYSLLTYFKQGILEEINNSGSATIGRKQILDSSIRIIDLLFGIVKFIAIIGGIGALLLLSKTFKSYLNDKH